MLEQFLARLCAYEAVALHLRRYPRLTRHVPPITRLVYAARRRPLPVFAGSLVAVVVFLVALAFHLLADGWDD